MALEVGMFGWLCTSLLFEFILFFRNALHIYVATSKNLVLLHKATYLYATLFD
jgi:hypothetical protein